MKPFLVFIVSLFFLLVSVSHAEDSPFYYTIDAVVNVAAKTIDAHQQVSFVNQTAVNLNDVYFHIYPNRHYSPQEIQTLYRYAGYFKVNPYPTGFQQGNMQVGDIRHYGQQLSYEIQGEDKTLLKVRLPQRLQPGERITLDLNFTVDIPHAFGRFGWNKNIIKAAYWYPVLSAQTETGWDQTLFYPFHRPFFSDAANYHVELRVPDQYHVIHSGSSLSTEVAGNEKKIVIDTDFPIRAFSFAMSPDYQLEEAEYNGIKLKSYYLPGNEKRARQALVNLKDVFEFYEKRFGPYPYRQFSIAPVHLGYGGEQMANMIFIDTRVYHLPELLNREFDLLIAHETGHQWFYNLLGVNTNEEMWLEEGVNSYFILQYLEQKYGYDADVLDYPDWFEPYAWVLPKASFRRMRDYRYQMEARMGYDAPLVGSLNSFRDPSRIFSVVYGKGVRLMEAIRARLGEEAFNRIFKKAVERYRYQNWSADDFVKLVAEEAGDDEAARIKGWIEGNGVADYAVYGAGKKIAVKHLSGNKDAVEVKVILTGGEEKQLVWRGRESVTEFEFDQEVRMAILDPDRKLFEIERLNNVWPRRWNFKPVPIYLGLYDMPLFLPEESYNIVFGPEVREGVGVKASIQEPYQQLLYAGTDIRLGEDIWSSRVGYVKKNLCGSPLSLGFEVENVDDLDGDQEDLISGKVFLRKDFNVWAYGLNDIQDHVTAYVIRNQRLNDADEVGSGEDDRNLEYRRREETIFGISYHLNRSAPYPDPQQGWRMNLNAEHGAHLLGAQQYFYRFAVDTARYLKVTPKTKLAARVKVGTGFPDDKDLFQLGGIDGLRGYDRKELRGANALLGILEYRFPLIENINYPFFGRLFTLQKIDGAVFGEAGRAWFSSYQSSEWKKDVGAGLRFHVNVAGFLEKVIVRLEAARAVDDPQEDSTRFWLSINAAF